MKRGVWLAVLLTGALGLAACGGKDSPVKTPEPTPEVTGASPTETEAVKEEKATEVAPGTGEGAPSAEKQIELPEGDGYQAGETISFADGDVSYELVIDRAEYTDKRNEYAQEPGNVLLVTYTYKNLGEGALLIDDMRFQLMSQDKSKMYELYYMGDEKAPESIEKGGTCTAQISYAIPEKETACVLGYQDTVNNNLQPAVVLLDHIE